MRLFMGAGVTDPSYKAFPLATGASVRASQRSKGFVVPPSGGSGSAAARK